MIALVIQNFGGLGGGSKSGLDVAMLLQNCGLNVEMAIDNPTEDILNFAVLNHIRVIQSHPSMIFLNYHSASGMPIKTLLRYKLTQKYLVDWQSFFKEKHYDLVVLNSSVLCPIAGVLHDLNIPFYIYVRETFRKNVIINKMQKKYISTATAVIYLTNYDSKQWNMNKASYVIPEMIGQLSSEEIIEEKSKQYDMNNFLYLGGLNYYKGVLDLLKAFELIIRYKKKAKLFILGETYNEYDGFSPIRKLISLKHVCYRKKCLDYINRINSICKDAVMIVGLTPDIEKYYLLSTAVVFPVKNVHQPRPAYEAGIYKKPIVLPDYDNFHEFIVDGYNGYYYKRNNIKSLADVLDSICRDPREANLRGLNNYQCTKENHNFEKAIFIMKDILNKTKIQHLS